MPRIIPCKPGNYLLFICGLFFCVSWVVELCNAMYSIALHGLDVFLILRFICFFYSMQIMRSIKRHKNVMSAMLAEHPTPAAEYFNQKRNILLQNSMMMSKRREDDDQMDDIMGSNGGSGNGAAGLCPSVVRYARPQMARSATGEWKFIVNTAQHTQTLRLEKCR